MVLRGLNLTFETIFLDPEHEEHKKPEFTKYNPNGRAPALIDHHNNDFVVWLVAILNSCSTLLTARDAGNQTPSFIISSRSMTRST